MTRSQMLRQFFTLDIEALTKQGLASAVQLARMGLTQWDLSGKELEKLALFYIRACALTKSRSLNKGAK